MNLVFGVEDGDTFQGGFEGGKYFGWPLCNIDHKRSTAESSVNPTSLRDW